MSTLQPETIAHMTNKPYVEQLKEPAAHPDDLLVMAFYNERPRDDVDLHFSTSQIVAAGNRQIPKLWGRAPRKIYYTENALRAGDLEFFQTLQQLAAGVDAEIVRAEEFFEDRRKELADEHTAGAA